MYSYPPQCMARNGEIFVPDLSGEEAPDYTIPDLSGERVAPETENETTTTEASFCGGIAGIMCPPGHTCQLDGDYPDAGGVCIPDNSR